MALDISEPVGTDYPGETPPPVQARPRTRSEWLRPHLGWAVVGAVLGYLLGHYLGDVIAGTYPVSVNTGTNNVAIVFSLALGVLGWLVGIGALNYPLAKMVGREPPPAVPEHSWVRYVRMTEDHKVVGMQYLVGGCCSCSPVACWPWPSAPSC